MDLALGDDITGVYVDIHASGGYVCESLISDTVFSLFHNGVLVFLIQHDIMRVYSSSA